MDVAVLICGMLREFPLASRSWSFRGHDCFLVTWDRTSDDNFPLGYSGEEPVGITPSMRWLRGVTIVPHDSPATEGLPRQCRAPWLWRVAEAQLAAYEAARGRPYDRVLVIRPDLYFGCDFDLSWPLGDNEIGAAGRIVTMTTGLPYLQDFRWLMSRDLFRRWVGFTDFFAAAGGGACPHAAFARWCVELGVTPLYQPMQEIIVRANSRERPWTAREDLFPLLVEDAEAWSRARHPDYWVEEDRRRRASGFVERMRRARRDGRI